MSTIVERLTPRTIRILFSVIAAIALALCFHNFLRFMVLETTGNDQCAWRQIPNVPNKVLITDVVSGGVADVAGVRDNDTLVAVNGQAVKNPFEAQQIINRVPAGDYAVYTLGRNGATLDVTIQILKLFDIRALSMFLFGFVFLIVGYVVVMTRPQGKIQRMFGYYGISAMLFFGLFSVSISAAILGRFLATIYLAGLILGRIFAIPVFILFFLYFPVRHPLLEKRWLRPALFALSLFATGPLLLQAFAQVNVPFAGLFFTAPLYFFITGLVFFAMTYFRKVDHARRNQLRPIFIAAAIDVLLFTYIGIATALNPFLFLLNPVAILPIIFIGVLPLAFGYSIFSYRLMDIDVIIKRSLIYGAITATIAAVYLLVVVGIGYLIGVLFGHANNQTLNIIAFVVIALIFDPVKRWVQASIDRYFYPERYNYQRALLEFSRDLPRQMNMEQILHSMIHTISGAMNVEKVGIVICDESEGCLTVSKNIPRELESYGDRPGGLIDHLRQVRRPVQLGLIGEESDATPIDHEDKRKIVSSGIVLSVPMFIKERLIGTINVGPKLSGKVYSQEDADLLATVAGQAAIAIENARLHRSEIEKQRMEEELTIARRIQQGLLPKTNPVIDGLDISGVSIPALSVGGDYFDFIHLADGRFLVVVADVSGKGMSAALYMSKIQGMIQLAAHMYRSPKEMLTEVNRRIYEGIERSSFITMILGMFDLERKEVTICRAGHNKALIGRNGDLRYAEATGIGLGLEHGPLFDRQLEEIRQPLEPGKLFVFYSDGLTEAMNERMDQFGEDQVFELVKTYRTLPAAQMQQSILNKVEQFRGAAEVHDDITLVIVKATDAR